jgi:hypothetical protein
MAADPTRKTPLAIIDLGNTCAHLSSVEGHLWLSIHGLPTETGKPPHLFDISVNAVLPTRLRVLADVVEEFQP